MAAFVGNWEHASAENMEAYMDAMGVPAEVKKLMDRLEIAVDGDTWTYNSVTGDKENKVSLKVGQMVEYKTPHGDSMKGIIKSVGDQVVEEHFYGDTKTDLVREVVNGQLCATLSAKGITAKVFYNKK